MGRPCVTKRREGKDQGCQSYRGCRSSVYCPPPKGLNEEGEVESNGLLPWKRLIWGFRTRTVSFRVLFTDSTTKPL